MAYLDVRRLPRAERITDRYVFFFGRTSLYSQWHPCTFAAPVIHHGEIVVSCAEQAMMLNKAALFKDHDAFTKILETNDPAQHKAIGRRVRGFIESRWSLVAPAIVGSISLAKFGSSPDLIAALIEDGRGRRFVEASATDLIWGVGLSWTDDRILDSRNWRGLNLLGKAHDDAYMALSGDE